MTDLTPDRLADWEGDPNDWPHTPPLDVWAKLTDRDSNFVWRVDSGHLINLLEAAIDALEAKTAEVDDLAADPGHKAAKYWKWWQREKARADRAEAALERVRALHRKAHAIFSWSEGGVRYEEPCENCNGAPGVHDCGCWADVQVEYVCAECDRGKGKHRDSGWPCPTVQAIEGADE